MSKIYIPEGYKSPQPIKETEIAIKEVKDYFERALASALNLTRVSAPLFVKPESGLNDNLNGVERPVTFGIKEQDDAEVEIVHSLAKWKRLALREYGFEVGEGLYTDMTAIRRDEETDNIPESVSEFSILRLSVCFCLPDRMLNETLIMNIGQRSREPSPAENPQLAFARIRLPVRQKSYSLLPAAETA